MTEKAKNYTDEQTARVREVYESAQDNDASRAEAVEQLAVELKRKPGSIRAKLVSEGIYIAKTYVSKAGTKTETKGTIVQSLAKLFNVAEERLAGLDKATKPTLEFLRSSIRDASETIAEDQRVIAEYRGHFGALPKPEKGETENPE